AADIEHESTQVDRLALAMDDAHAVLHPDDPAAGRDKPVFHLEALCHGNMLGILVLGPVAILCGHMLEPEVWLAPPLWRIPKALPGLRTNVFALPGPAIGFPHHEPQRFGQFSEPIFIF